MTTGRLWHRIPTALAVALVIDALSATAFGPAWALFERCGLNGDGSRLMHAMATPDSMLLLAAGALSLWWSPLRGGRLAALAATIAFAVAGLLPFALWQLDWRRFVPEAVVEIAAGAGFALLVLTAWPRRHA